MNIGKRYHIKIKSTKNSNPNFVKGWQKLTLQIIDKDSYIFMSDIEIEEWENNGYIIIKKGEPNE